MVGAIAPAEASAAASGCEEALMNGESAGNGMDGAAKTPPAAEAEGASEKRGRWGTTMAAARAAASKLRPLI